MQDGQPIMIDVGQAMTTDNYNAKELLERDIRNVNAFFRKRGADIIDDKVVFEETVNGKEEDEEEEE